MKHPVALLIACLVCQVRSEVVTVLHPEDEFDFGKTVVWSLLFQATWDGMNRGLGGKPERVDPPKGLLQGEERQGGFLSSPGASGFRHCMRVCEGVAE